MGCVVVVVVIERGSIVGRRPPPHVNPAPQRSRRERPLSGRTCIVCLSAVRPAHSQHQGTLAHGVLTGALAAAATAGALLGFGLRQGTPARPFNALAGLVLGDRAGGIWGFHSVVTVTGLVVHVTVTLGWGLLFARLARGMRGLRLAAAAFVAGAAALAVDAILVGWILGVDVSDALAPAQVVALHLVLGVALAVGMRLATSYLWSD
jgi:hypothetical protein